MDQQAKILALGTLGLATAIVCAYALTRRAARPASSKGPAEGSSSSKRNSKAIVEVVDVGVVKSVSGTEEDPSFVPPAPTTTISETLNGGGGGEGGASDRGLGGDEGASAASTAPAEDADAGNAVEMDLSGGGRAPAPGSGADPDEDAVETSLSRFNHAHSMAKKYFKAQRYDQAAEQYGIALSVCDKVPSLERKRTVLHNNRAAVFEKAGKYALALSECTMCLAREEAHPLARVRKSRVLEALGRPTDALAEVCAHLMLERDRVQAMAAINPAAPMTPPTPPANFEGLLEKIATARAEEVLAEKEKAASGGEAGTRKLKPLAKQAVTTLLQSFGSYVERQERYEDMEEADLTRELDESAGIDGVERVSSLFNRAMVRIVKRDYEGAREDVFEAERVLSKLEAEGETGVPSETRASILEWQGTFLQMVGDVEEAMKAYKRCQEKLESDGEPVPADVLVKMAWVCMDKEDTSEAKEYFERAMEEYPSYGTPFAHRARWDADTEGTSAVADFLETALELNEKDVFSWEQLARVHLQADDLNKAMETTDKGIKAVPNSEALLTLKAELKYSAALKAGDPSTTPEIIELCDAAIKADPKGSNVYLKKAAFLLQMMQDVGGSMEMLEKAVEVDPTGVGPLVQLANLKIMVAKSMEDAEAAKALLEKAVDLCNGKEELVETLSVLVATEGRIKGAKLLGRCTLS